MILRNRATQFPTIRARASLHEFHRPIFFLGNLLDIASQTFQRFFRSTIGHCLNFKIEGGKMEEIGKERGMFVRERVGTRFGFPSYALYLVLRVFETRGERGRIKALVLSQPSWEGLWRVSWQARVISKSYRGTWIILINRWKLYSSKSIPIPFLETRNNIHLRFNFELLELFFFEFCRRGAAKFRKAQSVRTWREKGLCNSSSKKRRWRRKKKEKEGYFCLIR